MMPALTNPQLLFDTFVNFEVRYCGLIPEIPVDVDPTGRTELLKVIDHGKKNGYIPLTVSDEQNAVLGLNAYSIRIVSKKNDQPLLSAPVHQISAVCHVTEGSENILGIKIGEVGGHKDISDLAVLHCKSKGLAEEICKLIGQCFQLVFSEATMQYFDKRRVEKNQNFDGLSFLTHSVASTSQTYGPEGPSFISGSRTDLNRIQPSKHQSSTTQSESDRTSAYAQDLINEYMHILNATLKPEELRQFAMLLKRWRSDDNIPFLEFCQKVFELYGSERKHLLARMRPFIPEKDLGCFEEFLTQCGASDNAEGSMPSWSPKSELSIQTQSLADSISSTVKNSPKQEELNAEMSKLNSNFENSIRVRTDSEEARL